MPEITKSEALNLGRVAIRQEVLTLQQLERELGDAFWECAQILIDCPGLVWITAVGTSASVAMRFAHVLTCSGHAAPCSFPPPTVCMGIQISCNQERS